MPHVDQLVIFVKTAIIFIIIKDDAVKGVQVAGQAGDAAGDVLQLLPLMQPVLDLILELLPPRHDT